MTHLEANCLHALYAIGALTPKDEFAYEMHLTECQEPDCIRVRREYIEEGDWGRRIQVIVSEEIIQTLRSNTHVNK